MNRLSILHIFFLMSAAAIAQPYFPVSRGGLWGAIDSNGTIVLEPAYKGYMHVHGPRNEFLISYNEDTVTIHGSGMRLIGQYTQYGPVTYGGAGRFIYRQDSIRFFGLYGLMDTSGKVLTPPIFELVHPFSSGLALARVSIGFEEGKKILREGLIDPSGKWVMEPTYLPNTLKSYAGGLIRFYEEGKGWGAMDKHAKVLITPKYLFLGECMNGFMEYKTLPGEINSGLMSTDEKILFPDDGKTSIHFWPCSISDTLVAVSEIKKTKKWPGVVQFNHQVYTLRGQKLFKADFKGLGWECYGRFQTEDLARGNGLIDAQGNELVKPQYSVIGLRQSYPIRVQDRQRKWGYIDYNGRPVVPCMYSDVSAFRNGLAEVYMGGTSSDYRVYGLRKPSISMGYVNNKGELIWPLSR